MKTILAFVLCLSMYGSLRADITVQHNEILDEYWGQKQQLVEDQAVCALEIAGHLLESELPSVAAPSEARRAALMLLDQIFHDERLDKNVAISDFLNARIEKVLPQITDKPTEGMRIVKLYNDGWVVVCPSVTIGLDIYRGNNIDPSGRKLMSDSLAAYIANECDILFITHRHSDHTDPFIVECFTRQNKLIVAPNEVMPENEHIIHVRRDSIWQETFITGNGMSLKTTILPGHQGSLENNIYAITTPEGYTVCTTGDQWLKDEEPWQANIDGTIPEVDVLLPICWADNLQALCRSFNAKLVLTGHENELGVHGVDHREPYWLSLHKLRNLGIPNCVMTWGEALEVSNKE